MPSKRKQAQAIADLVREQVASVDRMAPDALRAVIPALRAARDELRVDLGAWLKTVDGADRFTTYQMARSLRALEATLAAVKDTRPAMAGALKLGRHATGPLATDNLETEIVRLGQIFGEALSIPQIDTAAVIAKGDHLLWKFHDSSAKRYAGELGDDIKQQFAVGLAKGETISQTVNRLRKLSGWKRSAEHIDPGAHAGDIADAFFNRWRFKADRLVRTEVMNAYNVQHHIGIVEVNDERPDGEPEFLERWDASADNVTCPICRGLNGLTRKLGGMFRFEGSEWGAPPAHPYCRCVLIAWLKRWGDIKGEIPNTEPEQAPKEAKNAKRVAAAKIAAEASAERRREIHSAAKSNLPVELHAAWDEEGHKFMREEAGRIRGVKDRVNAASTISQAFSEKYGSGEETVHGSEGDRFRRRAEIEAKHAESWADEQEAKYYKAAQAAALADGEIDESGELTKRGRSRPDPIPTPPKNPSDDDPPF